MRAGLAVGVALSAAIALTSCASNESSTPSTSATAGGGTTSSPSAAAVSGTLAGVGSSAQANAQTAWIAAFQTANSGANVTYDPTGSGAGRTAFFAGGAQFAGSDSALKPEELAGTFKLCASGTKGIDIPVYVSPVALIYNITGVSKLNLDAATLAGIFSNKITKWNDPAIVALNKGVTLPSAAITPVHRSDKSGTTANFTDYLSKAAPSAWKDPSADVFPYSGEGALKGSGVVAAVKAGHNSIGYVDNSGAKGLTAASIKVGSSYVAPSAAVASKIAETSPIATGRAANDVVVQINRTTTDPTEYPITLVSNLIVCQTYGDPKVGALVKAYATYLTSSAGQTAAATAAGSAPITGALLTKAEAAAASIK